MLIERQYKPLLARSLFRPSKGWVYAPVPELVYAEVAGAGFHPSGMDAGLIYLATAYYIIVLPCLLDAQDASGWLTYDILEQAMETAADAKHRAHTGTWPSGPILGKDKVRLRDGDRMDRMWAITPRETMTSDRVRDYLAEPLRAVGEGLSLGVNAAYLSVIQRVMGADAVHITRTSLFRHLWVEREVPARGAAPVPPYAILMPVTPLDHMTKRRPVVVGLNAHTAIQADVPETPTKQAAVASLARVMPQIRAAEEHLIRLAHEEVGGRLQAGWSGLVGTPTGTKEHTAALVVDRAVQTLATPEITGMHQAIRAVQAAGNAIQVAEQALQERAPAMITP